MLPDETESSSKSSNPTWIAGTIAIICLPLLHFLVMSKSLSLGAITCWGTKSKSQDSSFQTPLAELCVNGSVWAGHWDLNPSLERPNSKNPADVDMSQRYHSNVETDCNMTDILKLSVNEVIAGHVNDAIEFSVIERLEGLRGQSLLQVGTSVDNRNLRFGCPTVFGMNRKVVTDNGVSISTCEIPLIEFTLFYVFNDALTMAFKSIEEQEDHLKKIDEVLAKFYSSPPPRYIVLSGIEWDLKWYKDRQKTIDWNYTFSVVREKVDLFKSHYSDAVAIFLRTQPFLIGKQGSLAPEEDFNKYNYLLREVVKSQRQTNMRCSSIRLADLAELMLYNGTAGWSDGVHPSGWVSMQYLNILLNVVSLLGEHCSR